MGIQNGKSLKIDVLRDARCLWKPPGFALSCVSRDNCRCESLQGTKCAIKSSNKSTRLGRDARCCVVDAIPGGIDCNDPYDWDSPLSNCRIWRCISCFGTIHDMNGGKRCLLFHLSQLGQRLFDPKRVLIPIPMQAPVIYVIPPWMRESLDLLWVGVDFGQTLSQELCFEG